jgi:CCS family citrate carrier protein
VTAESPPRASGAAAPSWLTRWWRLSDRKLGIIPWPWLLVLVPLLAAFVAINKLRSDILTNIAVLAVGGFGCAELGKRLPYLNQIGSAAIFATFVPSYLVYAHLLPSALVDSVTTFTISSNFLYLYISAIIVGSIFGMDRRVLIAGFVKIFAPLILGSLVALVTGVGVGYLCGLEPRHTLLFLVVPIMAGGVGEGAIPLSVGYAQFLPQSSGVLLAELLPPVMLGSLTAILISGTLNFVGKKYPHLTGEGRISLGERDEALIASDAPEVHPPVTTVAAAAVVAATLYLIGSLAHELWKWPGPVTMLFLAVLLKLSRLVSPDLERGAFAVFQFFRTAVTYPLLFAIGVAMTPWKNIIGVLTVANFVTIVATVLSMVGTGFLVARWIRMYPIDVAIVTACHSGQGGTGDVAILTAANRMQLMPFAQIATRIGGAITVTLTLAALATGH